MGRCELAGVLDGRKRRDVMRRVIIESPYAGDVAANVAYGLQCLKDSLLRGEAPFASHLLYTRKLVFDNTIPGEREKGIEAGLYWAEKAELSAVYVDRGLSSGMLRGIAHAVTHDRVIVFRVLHPDPNEDRKRQRIHRLWCEETGIDPTGGLSLV